MSLASYNMKQLGIACRLYSYCHMKMQNINLVYLHDGDILSLLKHCTITLVETVVASLIDSIPSAHGTNFIDGDKELLCTSIHHRTPCFCCA